MHGQFSDIKLPGDAVLKKIETETVSSICNRFMVLPLSKMCCTISLHKGSQMPPTLQFEDVCRFTNFVVKCFCL